MSLAEARAEIKAALDTLPFLAPSLKRPDSIVPPACWPQWRGLTRDGLLVASWAVVIAVGTTEEAAIDFVDENLVDLAYALRPAGFVSGAEPVVISTNVGDMMAVAVTLTRE